MLQIACPCCGVRDEDEFAYGGEAHRLPPEPGGASDAEWAEYLYLRDNPKGISFERWCHRFGCGQWFHVARDTLSHRIAAVYRVDEPRPDLPGADA